MSSRPSPTSRRSSSARRAHRPPASSARRTMPASGCTCDRLHAGVEGIAEEFLQAHAQCAAPLRHHRSRARAVPTSVPCFACSRSGSSRSCATSSCSACCVTSRRSRGPASPSSTTGPSARSLARIARLAAPGRRHRGRCRTRGELPRLPAARHRAPRGAYIRRCRRVARFGGNRADGSAHPGAARACGVAPARLRAPGALDRAGRSRAQGDRARRPYPTTLRAQDSVGLPHCGGRGHAHPLRRVSGDRDRPGRDRATATTSSRSCGVSVGRPG